MNYQIDWYLMFGPLLLLIALVGTRVARLPLTTAMIYLVIGWLLATLLGLQPHIVRDGSAIEIAAEIAVIVSLFSAGLRLRLPLKARPWRLPVALATLGMALTVGLIASIAVMGLGLPLGAAIILGAIIAPTDPVLASDIQVEDSDDQDPVRLTLTAEAGLNDGTAFPFLLLGLGLLGIHDLGPYGMSWLSVDVLWQAFGGIGVGAGMGWATTHLVLHLRRTHGEAFGFDDFLALGIIASTYGLASLMHCYGFLAVFAAGWALRGVERRDGLRMEKKEDAALASSSPLQHPERAPSDMAEALLQFNSQIDRIGELALMLLTGALLATLGLDLTGLALGAILFLLVRPLCVGPLCMAAGLKPAQTLLICWFGIRGIGSLFYLAYAITHGLPSQYVGTFASMVVAIVALSTIVHGVTSTPSMRAYVLRHGDGRESNR